MAYQNTGTGVVGTGTSATVGEPPGSQVDDIVEFGIYLHDNAEVPAVAGWTVRIDQNTGPTTRGHPLVLYKRLVAADIGVGTYTATWTTSCAYSAVAIGRRGRVKAGDPYDDTITASSSSSSALGILAVLVTRAFDSDLTCWGSNHATDAGAWSPPASMTERYDPSGAGVAHLNANTQDAVGPGSYSKTTSGSNTASGTFPKNMLSALMAETMARAATTTGAPASVAAFSPTLPAYDEGYRLEFIVSGKYADATVATIDQSWTLAKAGTGGTGVAGNDTGTVFIWVYMLDVPAGFNSVTNPLTAPTLTTGATPPNSWEWSCHAIAPATGKVMRDAITTNMDAVQFGDDTNTASPLTATAGAFAGQPTQGDHILIAGVIPTDLGSNLSGTSTTITATGLTDGKKTNTAAANSQYVENALGTDSAQAWGDWMAFAGTASAGVAISLAVSSATNHSGMVVAIANRQTDGPTIVALGQATETDTALALTVAAGAVVGLGQPAETDTALPLTAVLIGSQIVLGQAEETDTALPVTMTSITPITVVLDLTEETDTALALTVHAVATLGLAAETDTALPLTIIGAAVLSLGLATETDTALPLSVVESVTLGLATETDTALPLTVLVITTMETDTSNLAGGRYRDAGGEFIWDPPVVPRPAEWRDAPAFHSLRRAVAQAIVYNGVDGKGVPDLDVTLAYVDRWRPRLVIGNRDVTYWRGVPVIFGGYQLIQPFGWGPTQVSFKQATLYERPGFGDLKWLRDDSPVRWQWVDDATEDIMETAYRGQVIAWDVVDGYWQCQIGGEVTGPSSMRNEQIKLVRGRARASRQIAERFADLAVPFRPRYGGDPGTGPLLARSGGMGHLENLTDLVSQSTDRQGNQFTVMPDDDGVFHYFRRDTETIDFTFYADDARVAFSAHRDLSEEPTRIYAEAVSPTGQRIRFAIYPGLVQGAPPPYPELTASPGTPWGIGTEDADLDDGAGVTLLVDRLIIIKRLDLDDRPDGFDSEVNRVLFDFQDYAGLPATGLVDEDTWRALYDLSVTGFSHRWAKIEPAAQDYRTRKWNRGGSGAPITRNKRYDPTVGKRDLNLQMGSGKPINWVREWSQAKLHLGRSWTATATFKGHAVIPGLHVPGDPIPTPMQAVSIRPGMNGWEPNFDDGTLFHVTAVDVARDTGEVTVTLDTRARDAQEVWEVIDRARETRESPARNWIDQRRASTLTKDSTGTWDQVGGRLYLPQHLTGGTWNVFPVVGGQEGTVRWIDIKTHDAETTWVMAVFGRRIYPARLNRLIGDPFTTTGRRKWNEENVRDALDNDFYVLGVWGDWEAPCGYWPGNKSETSVTGTDGAVAGIVVPVTGRFRDKGGFSYFTFDQDSLWVAMYPRDDTTIDAGRIMRNQLEAGT